jgi:hypothetical protein
MNANDQWETALEARPLADGGKAPRPLHAVRPVRRVTEGRDIAELEGPAARIGSLAQAVAGRIRARPLASIAFAIGIGFAVGGALSFRAGRVALAAAARHIARELLKQVL